MSNSKTIDDFEDEIQNKLSDTDVVILEQSDLDAFIEQIGGPSKIPDAVTVFTDDSITRRTVEFNLIEVDDNGQYGTATQIHQPVMQDDVVLDLRDTNQSSSFADWLQGL